MRKKGRLFWSELSGCVKKRKKGKGGSHVAVLGGLNASVGNDEVVGVMGKYGMPEGMSMDSKVPAAKILEGKSKHLIGTEDTEVE